MYTKGVIILKLKEIIKAIRAAEGLTQTEFAKKLGVGKSAVTNWEYGINTPSPIMVEKICTVYKVNPLYMSGESNIMHLPPDTDEELIDAALADGDPIIKALLVAIVKKPDGWKALAESILTAADLIKRYTGEQEKIDK